jgi:hypothetical protein
MSVPQPLRLLKDQLGICQTHHSTVRRLRKLFNAIATIP